MRIARLLPLLTVLPLLVASAPASAPASDPVAASRFLVGEWAGERHADAEELI